MLLLEKKEKNRFVLKLHQKIYPEKVLAKVLEQDKTWVTKKRSSGPYHIIELNTIDRTDVLDWANYLLYVRKKENNA